MYNIIKKNSTAAKGTDNGTRWGGKKKSKPFRPYAAKGPKP